VAAAETHRLSAFVALPIGQSLEQLGGAEDDLTAGEDDPPTVGLDDRLLGEEAGVGGPFVLPPFDVNVGAHAIEQSVGGRRRVDDHMVDEDQSGEVLGAKVLGDVGPLRAFRDVAVAR